MIVRENKEFIPLCNISTGETFKYRDNFYMVVCLTGEPESGHTFCVDLETGWICQIKLSTHVEKVDCICNIRSYENENNTVLEQAPILEKDGTLVITTNQYEKVTRVLVQHGINGTLFYQDNE